MEVKYYKLRADFKYTTKGRFYRTFLVREDIGLGELGELIVNIFGGSMEHFFMYHTGEKAYIPSSWMDQWDNFARRPHESFKDKTIIDLPERFMFIYDTGDGWDFDCKIYKQMVTKSFEDDEEVPTGYVLDGKGMGIWEDNIRTLFAYFEGEIDKDYNQEDEDRGIFKPWNFDINKYSEFDDPIDIEELNDRAMYFYPSAEDMY